LEAANILVKVKYETLVTGSDFVIRQNARLRTPWATLNKTSSYQ